MVSLSISHSQTLNWIFFQWVGNACLSLLHDQRGGWQGYCAKNRTAPAGDIATSFNGDNKEESATQGEQFVTIDDAKYVFFHSGRLSHKLSLAAAPHMILMKLLTWQHLPPPPPCPPSPPTPWTAQSTSPSTSPSTPQGRWYISWDTTRTEAGEVPWLQLPLLSVFWSVPGEATQCTRLSGQIIKTLTKFSSPRGWFRITCRIMYWMLWKR